MAAIELAHGTASPAELAVDGALRPIVNAGHPGVETSCPISHRHPGALAYPTSARPASAVRHQRHPLRDTNAEPGLSDGAYPANNPTQGQPLMHARSLPIEGVDSRQ